MFMGEDGLSFFLPRSTPVPISPLLLHYWSIKLLDPDPFIGRLVMKGGSITGSTDSARGRFDL